jgi:hypothetical protein
MSMDLGLMAKDPIISKKTKLQHYYLQIDIPADEEFPT